MKIEAVIICVNYSDFLAHTLPSTCSKFNKLVVVTDTKDHKTKNLCEYYNVQCVQTDVFYENGDLFNKGKGINAGLKELDLDGWVVHLDADIYLPPLTRSILESLPLDQSKIYGADRLMCPSHSEWIKYKETPASVQEAWIYIHLNRFPVGIRIAEYKTPHGGYEPIGYFQLWNPTASQVFCYPDEHGLADRTDVLHCKKWPRAKRELLPEVVVIHLESDPEMGINWQGRKSSLFKAKDESAPVVKVLPSKPKSKTIYRFGILRGSLLALRSVLRLLLTGSR